MKAHYNHNRSGLMTIKGLRGLITSFCFIILVTGCSNATVDVPPVDEPKREAEKLIPPPPPPPPRPSPTASPITSPMAASPTASPSSSKKRVFSEYELYAKPPPEGLVYCPTTNSNMESLDDCPKTPGPVPMPTWDESWKKK